MSWHEVERCMSPSRESMVELRLDTCIARRWCVAVSSLTIQIQIAWPMLCLGLSQVRELRQAGMRKVVLQL